MDMNRILDSDDVLEPIEIEQIATEIDRLRDILDRISAEAPGAVPACNCGVAESCNCCEIRHLLDIYNGRVPDGPYRRPQPALTTYKPTT